MKLFVRLLHLKATLLPALTAWTGVFIYFVYNQSLPDVSFWIWRYLFMIFMFPILSLVYFKFFGYYKLTGVVLAFLGTFLVLDVVSLFVYPRYLAGFTMLDFIASYALMVAEIALTYVIYYRSWKKRPSKPS